MSWSVTIQNVQEYEGFSHEIVEQMLTQHPQYPRDMALALSLAREAGLASASLSGGRTPNPYGDDETVNISIVGMEKALDFDAAMRRNIAAGPDADALTRQALASEVA
jgi:hypothetical protein